MDIKKSSLITNIQIKNWNVKLKGEKETSKIIKINLKEYISTSDDKLLKEMKMMFDGIKKRYNYQDFYITVCGYFLYEPQETDKISVSYSAWRSGKIFKYSSNKIIFYAYNDMYDDNSGFTGKLNSIILYIIPFSIKAGDDDKHNDCFFNCLKKCIYDIKNPFDKKKKTNKYMIASDFKKYLNIDRDDKITINNYNMNKIEELTGCKINVINMNTNKYIYKSNFNEDRRVIKLYYDEENNHMTIKDKEEEKHFYMYNNPKEILLVYQYKDIQYECYYGDEIITKTKEEFKELQSNKSKYLCIHSDKKDLKAFYETYKKIIEDGKELYIDMMRYMSIKDMILHKFYLYSRSLQFDELTLEEQKIMKNCYYFPLMYVEKDCEGDMKSYDVNQMHTSCMRNSKLLIPIKQGEFKKMTNDEFQNLKFFMIGCYHCKIEKSMDENVNKLFVFNEKKNDWYCYNDVKRAKELNLKISLIEDEENNILLYSRDKCLTGEQIFSGFINRFYKFEEDGKMKKDCSNENKLIKIILSTLHGVLNTKDKRELKLKDKNDKIFEIDNEKYYLSKIENMNYDYEIENNNRTKITLQNKINNFLYNTARCGPFILSFVRYTLSSDIMEFVDDLNTLKRINTDSFTVLNNNDVYEKIKSRLTPYLGDYKIETKKSGLLKIIHVNKFEKL